MKKHTLATFRLLLVLAFSLLAENSLIFTNFAYADESLNSFQQEVIYAKQKHQEIAGKMQSVQMLLDKEKTRALQDEAESLIGELMAKNYSGSQTAELKLEKSTEGIRLEVKDQGPRKKSAKKPKKEDKKPWPWSKFVFKEASLSEGDAVYKVAASDNKITMKEAIEIGLANNLQIRAFKKKIEVAQSKLTEAKRALFPTVQGVLEENSGKVGGTDTNPGGRLYKGRNYKLNVSQPIFYGGELTLTVKQAEANLKSSKEEYEKTKNEYVLQVKTAYFGVVKAEYNVQYQWELYEKVNTIHKRVKQEHAQGVTAEVDSLDVESKYHQVFFQVESGKSDLLSANMVLRQTLSLGLDKSLPVDLKLGFVKVNPDFNTILEIALQRNADVKIKKFALESAEYGVLVFKAKKMPRIDLRGSYGLLGEIFKDNKAVETNQTNLDIEKEWFLGMTASMPLGPNSIEYNKIKHIYGPTVLALHGSEDSSDKVALNLFDRFSDITDEKGAQAALLQSHSDYQKAKDDLTIRVKDDFYNLQKSLIQIDSSIAKIRYQDKKVPILEYLVSLQETSMETYLEELVELAISKFSFIQAVTDYDLAVSGLAASIGDPNYFENETKS